MSRKELSARWSVSGESLKRYEKRGLLQPVKIAPRVVRYRLRDILKIEDEGTLDRSISDPAEPVGSLES